MDLSSRLSSLRNIDSSSDTLPSYSNPNDRNIIKSLLVKGKSLIGKEKHRTFDLPQSNKEHFPSHPIDKKTIPPEFISPGVPLVRVTHKKKVNKSFRIDFDNGLLVWDSKASFCKRTNHKLFNFYVYSSVIQAVPDTFINSTR